MNIEREVQVLNINDVLPNRFQPRITFDEKAIMELADSIKEHGVIQPIVVRRIADKFEIIAGERRYKASVLAGKTTIPAIVTDLDDKDSAEIALIENVQRQDLTPIEEAVSYKKILDMGYLNQSELATKLGKTQSTIANKLRLLNLTDEVQEALLKERISERHARSLLKLDKEKQNMMLNRIISERMTVRKTDEEISKIVGSNIEVLDFGTREEKKDMNNEMNNFNIPTSPIIEPITSTQNSENMTNSSYIAPVITNENVIQPVVDDQSFNSVQPNLFSNPLEVELPSVETINPGFMDVSKIEAQAVDINSASQNEYTNDQSQFETSSFQGIPFEQPVIENNPIENQLTSQNIINNEPSVGKFFTTPLYQNEENQSFDMFNGAIIQPENQVDENNVQNLNPFQPVLNDQIQVDQNVGFNPALAGFGLNNSVPLYQPNQTMETGFVSQPSQVETPSLFDQNRSVVEMGGSGYIAEEPILQPLMNFGSPVVKPDMKEAILLIRNCSKEIEKLGFKLDVEEIDFENYYQAIFKIEKN